MLATFSKYGEGYTFKKIERLSEKIFLLGNKIDLLMYQHVKIRSCYKLKLIYGL